jgi:hypothetical protein
MYGGREKQQRDSGELNEAVACCRNDRLLRSFIGLLATFMNISLNLSIDPRFILLSRELFSEASLLRFFLCVVLGFGMFSI